MSTHTTTPKTIQLELPLEKYGNLLFRLPRLPGESMFEYKQRLKKVNRIKREPGTDSLQSLFTRILNPLKDNTLQEIPAANIVSFKTLYPVDTSKSYTLMADFDNDGSFNPLSISEINSDTVLVDVATHPGLTQEASVKFEYTPIGKSESIIEVNDQYLLYNTLELGIAENKDLVLQSDITQDTLDAVDTISVIDLSKPENASLESSDAETNTYRMLKWDGSSFDGKVINKSRTPVDYNAELIASDVTGKVVNGTAYGDDCSTIGTDGNGRPVVTSGIFYYQGKPWYYMPHPVLVEKTTTPSLTYTSSKQPKPGTPIIVRPFDSRLLIISEDPVVDDITAEFRDITAEKVDDFNNATVPNVTGFDLPDLIGVTYVAFGRTYVELFKDPADWTVTLQHHPDDGTTVYFDFPNSDTQYIYEAGETTYDVNGYDLPHPNIAPLPFPPHQIESVMSTLVDNSAYNVPNIDNLPTVAHINKLVPDLDIPDSALNKLMDNSTFPVLHYDLTHNEDGTVTVTFSEVPDSGCVIIYETVTSNGDTSTNLIPEFNINDVHLNNKNLVITEKKPVDRITIESSRALTPTGVPVNIHVKVLDQDGCGMHNQKVNLFISGSDTGDSYYTNRQGVVNIQRSFSSPHTPYTIKLKSDPNSKESNVITIETI